LTTTSAGQTQTPFDKTKVDLSIYTGRFFSEELATFYDFKLIDGKLIGQHLRSADFEIKPDKADEFSAGPWLYGQIKFLRNDTGNIAGCTISFNRTRNLHFNKIELPAE
ncbi:hypothetical protein, partial [Noviherbaspirillum sp. ST9]